MKIEVRAKTGSRQNCVRLVDGLIYVETTAQPHDGEANKKIIDLLAGYYKVGKSQIKIVRGAKNSHKVVEIGKEIC